ncbi:MarR family winged helix-turn-helix transcriptional regulator [Gracilibacillus dipsosauri]|uniref:MarR family winged helix-turn-helix transcriptional regulator n=1 Tax=Gracilibacillus dipsosauri TaxID=178340 RepID=UPI003241FB85
MVLLNDDLHNLSLFDMLSERQIQLRKLLEDLRNDHSEIILSNSEWYILAKIDKKEPTIASVAKNVDISRQATHKFIKNLAAKGLIEIIDAKHNKKEKCIRLTDLGISCYEKNEALKKELEDKMAVKIGKEQLQYLKNMLKIDWGL